MKKINGVAYLQILHVGIYVKTTSNASGYKQCSNALFVKSVTNSAVTFGIYVKADKARSDEALQTLQTLHIFESQARVRI